MTWYYGYLRDNEAGERVIEKALQSPQLKADQSKLTFMYVQILWNLRDYDKCMGVLSAYSGDNDPLIEMFRDMTACYKMFLPDRLKDEKNIQVYGKEPRTEQEKREYRAAYLELNALWGKEAPFLRMVLQGLA